MVKKATVKGKDIFRFIALVEKTPRAISAIEKNRIKIKIPKRGQWHPDDIKFTVKEEIRQLPAGVLEGADSWCFPFD